MTGTAAVVGVPGTGGLAGALVERPGDRARTEAVVDYHAQTREAGHVVDLAARSEPGGVLHVELTVADAVGSVVGEGALRLAPAPPPPPQRVPPPVLRGLTPLPHL